MPKKVRLAKTVPNDADILEFDSATGLWTPVANTGGGITICSGYTPADGDILVYDGVGACWKPVDPTVIGLPIEQDPRSYPDLVLWFKPESLVQYGSGGTITQWDDSSGNDSHLDTYADATKFTAKASAIDGYYALDNGADILSRFTIGTGAPSGLHGWLGIIVTEKANWTDDTIVMVESGTSPVEGIMGGDSPVGVYSGMHGNQTYLQTGAFSDYSGTGYTIWMVCRFSVEHGNGTQIQMYPAQCCIGDGDWQLEPEGVQNVSSPQTGMTLDAVGSTTPGQQLRGEIAEMIVWGTTAYANAITDGDFPKYRNVVEHIMPNYVKKKYATVYAYDLETHKPDEGGVTAADWEGTATLKFHWEAPHFYSNAYGLPNFPAVCNWAEYDSADSNMTDFYFTKDPGSRYFTTSPSYRLNGYSGVWSELSTQTFLSGDHGDCTAIGTSGFTVVALLYTPPGVATTEDLRLIQKWGVANYIDLDDFAGTASVQVYDGTNTDLPADSTTLNANVNSTGANLVVVRRASGGDYYVYANAVDCTKSTRDNSTGTFGVGEFLGLSAESDQAKAFHCYTLTLYDGDIGVTNINGLCNAISDKYALNQYWSVT